MRRPLAALTLALATALPALADDATTPPLPIAQRAGSAWDVLLAQPDHRRFATLAALVGLDRVLDGAHQVTVFAPIDAAFDKLPAGELD